MQMYKDGKIIGVSYEDSLFRGVEIYGDVKDIKELVRAAVDMRDDFR